jgi:methylated-DNA-[protein]-cysteine S-methyltransferase
VRQSLLCEQIDSPLGRIVLLADEEGALRALDFDTHLPRLHRLLRNQYGAVGYELVEGAVDRRIVRALERYFAGDLEALDGLAVRTAGTPFQESVWRALREIPAGATTTYGVIAGRIGRPQASRAVGAANGANPVALVVPCHRVIGADATLTGYGGGIERKRWLLEHEARRGLLF